MYNFGSFFRGFENLRAIQLIVINAFFYFNAPVPAQPQVPTAKQGGLHGALAALRTLVAVVSVPSFSLIFAWSIGDKSASARTAAQAAAQGALEGVGGATTQLGVGKVSQNRAPTLSPTFTNFTKAPTHWPSSAPSASPSQLPSQAPTQLPSDAPTESPSESSQSLASKLIGGKKDGHGCLSVAGYSWCAGLSKCVRDWETNCNSTTFESMRDSGSPSALSTTVASNFTKAPTHSQSSVPSASPSPIPSQAVIFCSEDVSFYTSCFDDCVWSEGANPCSISNSTACLKDCDADSIFAAVDYFSCYCESSKSIDDLAVNRLNHSHLARSTRHLSGGVSFTTHDNDDVGLSESHLEVPFLVASTLFNVAAVLALIVMRKFPNLGKGQSGH